MFPRVQSIVHSTSIANIEKFMIDHIYGKMDMQMMWCDVCIHEWRMNKKGEKRMDKTRYHHNFINPFMAFAIAKLLLAMTCLDSFVNSGIACTSLSLFACSLSSRRMSFPCWADAGGRLSLQTATILDTMVMICVRFSFRVGEGVGLRTPDSTLWIAYTIDSVWASR